jgi:hypothetical protein
MTIIKRTCKNCASFSPDPDSDDATQVCCWNHIIEVRGATVLHRAARATDCCEDHMTRQEDEAEAELIEAHREQGGMEQVLRVAPSIFMARRVIRQAQRSQA